MGAGAVALLCAGYLAQRNAPRPDEFHTLSHLGHASISDLWASYRGADDATPPFGYLTSWASGRVLGTGMAAVRAPFVLSWAVAAAGLAVLTRRAGSWASFAAGTLPSATALVYLGAYARGYAPVLACLVLAACAWQRAAEVDRAGWWLVAVGALGAAATSWHYAAAFVIVLMAGTTATVGRPRPHRRGRIAAPVVGVAIAVAGAAVVLSQAIDAHRHMPEGARLLDAVTYWPSAASPAVVPLALAVLVVALGLARRSSLERVRAGSGLAMELVAFGWFTALIVPIVAVAVMWAVRGASFHRYAVGALLGAGIVVAHLTGAVARPRMLGPVVAGLLVVAAAVATLRTGGEMVTVDQARGLPAALELDRGNAPVVVVDEYDLLLLRRFGDADLRDRLRLVATPGVVGSPRPVDVDALLAGGRALEVVGSAGEVEELLGDVAERRTVTVAAASFPRPGSDRDLVHVRVRPAP